MAITIKDVAKEADVSISTVSKVINKSHTISQSTIARVNEVMKKLNYYPNQSASNFARQSTRNIVFLTKLERDVAFSNPHMFEIMCGVQKALSDKNYNLSLMSVNSDQEEKDQIKKIIAQKSADGIILHGSVINRDLTPLLVNTNFPHIMIGKPEFESQLCWIDTNNHLSGEIAANHLLECGYRKIAFIGGHENDMISLHRLQGFQSVMEQKALEIPKAFISFGDSTKDSGYIQMNQILDNVDKPEAVICENNSIALGAVKSINKRGLSIPDNIAVITFDEYPFSHIIEPVPTVVNINVFDMGMQAASTLIRKIKNPSLQVQSYTTLPELIIRRTTARQ